MPRSICRFCNKLKRYDCCVLNENIRIQKTFEARIQKFYNVCPYCKAIKTLDCCSTSEMIENQRVFKVLRQQRFERLSAIWRQKRQYRLNNPEF